AHPVRGARGRGASPGQERQDRTGGSAPCRTHRRPVRGGRRMSGQDNGATGRAVPAGAARVNDFALKIGTVNGTGSASAHSLLRQAIFRMGIPVSGKNLFPSNIQGLPTWYEIRVNARGHTARCRTFDLLVAMNPASYARDIREVRDGGWVLFDDTWPLRRELRREGVTFLGAPIAELCREHFDGDRARILMKNIVYVGILTALLEIEPDVVRTLLEETFARKKA